jgi:hypothetical protein
MLPTSTPDHNDGPNGNGCHPETHRPVELHVVQNGRWVAIDLDELLESIEFAGLPRELIVTYMDANGRRRYVERCPARKRKEAKA